MYVLNQYIMNFLSLYDVFIDECHSGSNFCWQLRYNWLILMEMM